MTETGTEQQTRAACATLESEAERCEVAARKAGEANHQFQGARDGIRRCSEHLKKVTPATFAEIDELEIEDEQKQVLKKWVSKAMMRVALSLSEAERHAHNNSFLQQGEARAFAAQAKHLRKQVEVREGIERARLESIERGEQWREDREEPGNGDEGPDTGEH